MAQALPFPADIEKLTEETSSARRRGFAGSTFLALAETRSGGAAATSSAMARAMREYETLTVATAEQVMRYLKVRLSLIQTKVEAGAVA